MSLLVKNSLPAERKRNLNFAENFVNAQQIRENGGRLQGDPAVDFGAVLDGTADKITWTQDFFDVKTIVMLVKLDTTTEEVMKLSASHSIAASSGTLTATGVTSPTYYIGGSATQTIGTDETWVAISTATAFDVDDLQVGFITGYGAMTIKKLMFFKEELTDKELEDYSNGDWTSYRNQTVGDWPMTMENHDLDNLRTLDVSGNGNHLAMGTGSVATRPTKNTTEQGYYIDGNDFFDIGSGLGITDFPFTLSLMFRTLSQGLAGIIDLADTGSTTRNMGIYMNTSEVIQVQARNPNFNTAGTIVGDYGNWIHGVCTFVSAAERSIYINGEFNATSTVSTAFFTPDRFTVGRFGDQTPGANYVGDAAKAKAWNDRALTPLQIHDLALRDFKQINNV